MENEKTKKTAFRFNGSVESVLIHRKKGKHYNAGKRRAIVYNDTIRGKIAVCVGFVGDLEFAEHKKFACKRIKEPTGLGIGLSAF
ncbi:MAG: hypothetical protein IK141_01950 [Clostridia bacterium]|nr:hypothetical protein [Clostridia bacterium]